LSGSFWQDVFSLNFFLPLVYGGNSKKAPILRPTPNDPMPFFRISVLQFRIYLVLEVWFLVLISFGLYLPYIIKPVACRGEKQGTENGYLRDNIFQGLLYARAIFDLLGKRPTRFIYFKISPGQ